MTWNEILKASGGKAQGKGNNNHDIFRSYLKKEAQQRLSDLRRFADTLFSLRLDNCTRIYGVRESNCLRIVFFDPFHCDHAKSAYKFPS